jgi:hypothetical protein
MLRAGTISPSCGGRKGSAARYAASRIIGSPRGAYVTAGVRSADLGDGGDLVRGHAFALASVVRSALARPSTDQGTDMQQAAARKVEPAEESVSYRLRFIQCESHYCVNV